MLRESPSCRAHPRRGLRASHLPDDAPALRLTIPQACSVLLEDATVYVDTLSVNGALVTAAKYIVQRPLPRTYAGDPALVNQPGGYRSFYSGHTSLVVAALSATAVTLTFHF